jgi:predicted Zn-dependent protease
VIVLGGVAVNVELKDDSHRYAWLAAYGVGAVVGVVLPYSRLNEDEADEIGLIYAAKAGYDPGAGITFWRRMMEASQGKAKLPPFLSTHPTDEWRIEHIQSLIPKILPVFEQYKVRP